MAQSSLTPQEFIQNAFAPQIAILCSEDADNICLKNNLRFVELLQPFSRTSEVRIAEPSGNIVTMKNLKMYFEDMNRRPPQPTLGKKILSEAVSSASWDQEVKKTINSWTGAMNIELDLQTTTPWFEEWRDIFLQIQYPSDHEFSKHYIACIFVISAGSENPLDQLNRLSQYQHQQQHQNPTRFPKWFSPNIMKYYLLVHDVDEVESAKAEQIFEQMTSAYGSSSCHHLHINSRPVHQSDANMPDPWQRLLQHRGLVEGSSVGVSGSSETSSGTGTPREDLVGLPTKVTEGDSSESSSDTPTHPLSPVAPPPDEKNGLVDTLPPADVPLLLNRQSLLSETLPSQGVQHGGCLTPSDVDRIRIFVDEFCLRALVPHVERQIRHLTDVVTNRSRSKSLLSATRRWLGGGAKPPSGSATSVVYSQEATELQTRRLGDLCFMFGLYEAAYNAYYTAKNDFKGDQAWLYFAGAQEMAALAAFMQNQTEYPKRYFEGSLHTYLNVCKVYNFAIRLTLLSTEVLKNCSEFGEAAMMFIKMTSEESDLLSALMLEQAAHCFINSRRPLPRKYAFHMTLAGHRFSKAGQRSHSLRAYKQAFQVYFNRGWILAEDHIHYTMGKQAFQLHLTRESLEATTRLIDQGAKTNAPTQQSAALQQAYMREFLNILDKCLREEPHLSKDLVSLPVPILDGQSTKVILGDPLNKTEQDWQPASHMSFIDEDWREKRWFALEREVRRTAQGPAMIFRPNLQRLTAATPNTHPPTVPLKERVALEIRLRNPLLISLSLSSIRPVYSFFDESGKEELLDGEDNSQNDPCVRFEAVSGVVMPPASEEVITLALWPQRPGRVVIRGIAYHIALTREVAAVPPGEQQQQQHGVVSVGVQQRIELRGPRLNNTLREKTSIVYAKDERLNVHVGPQMPRLHVALRDPPAILSCGELRCVDMLLSNVGTVPLKGLRIAVSQPRNVYFTLDSRNSPDSCVSDAKLLQHVRRGKDYSCVGRVQEISLPDGTMAVGETLRGHLWLHAPQSPTGAFDVELLFYYESEDPRHKKRYRLLRHLSSIYLYPSISLKAKSFPSVGLLPDLGERFVGPCHRHHSTLVFHIKNRCEVENGTDIIDLIGISGNSALYALIPYNLEGSTCVKVNESCQLCVQCAHVQERKEDHLISSYIPTKNNHHPLVPCWWEFALMQRLKLPELSSDPPPTNPLDTYDAPPPTENQIKGRQLKESLELDLVASVIWKGKRGDEEIIGLHSVYLDRLGEEIKDTAELRGGAGEECTPIKIIREDDTNTSADQIFPSVLEQQHLIKVSLNLPSEVSHDFRKEALCRINYSATFYNSCACSHFAEVRFSSKGMMNNDGGESQVSNPQAGISFLSVGVSTHKFLLEGFQSKTLEIRSVVTAPGTYSLGAFSLKVRRDDSSEWVPQSCNHLQNGVLVRMEAPTAMDRHMASELSSIHSVSSAAAHSS